MRATPQGDLAVLTQMMSECEDPIFVFRRDQSLQMYRTANALAALKIPTDQCPLVPVDQRVADALGIALPEGEGGEMYDGAQGLRCRLMTLYAEHGLARDSPAAVAVIDDAMAAGEAAYDEEFGEGAWRKAGGPPK